ncbi:MAG TPA: Rne/Rng family ribonuclease [Pseudolabrys sp.]|nr:Rne/Rng family ribonuclease [Pseudolabrys sp.]
MPNKMLIDASHPEETRVVVLRGNRVEEFDFESANRKQLRGNIYLAKVTRVEPSLQAAFVDYGGNRHGFLAFSEIHPDYYQIPVADRQALIAEDERNQRDDEDGGRRNRHRHRNAHRNRNVVRSEPLAADASEMPEGQSEQSALQPAEGESPDGAPSAESTAEVAAEAAALAEPAAFEPQDSEAADDQSGGAEAAETATPDAGEASESTTADQTQTAEGATHNASSDPQNGNGNNHNGGDDHSEDEAVESVGGADALEEVQERMPRFRRQYKIQEVIKRRQVMLVQVVKEERGTKGAALTTYLSLAGRYSVLMPNTARGGGISRKITSAEDRSRLKEIAQDLEVPEGMGVILRTAGASRTKVEVKRDFEYLLRLWEQVRDLTLKSTAPKLVYEEGSLTKRSIRDLYNKDIEEIVVAGDEGYKDAKEFMRMLMPSHAKYVKLYKDTQPIFTRYGIESQLDAMFTPVVQLRSGGYIVINQAEALVAIDVNSGRATREHHIEDTALKTNIEAAEEIARQLRLRDLAGLIVIDFIDMDEGRNNRTVERRLKESLRHDRARIQVGRISHFGLLEMSRQRIRTSVLESSTEKCPVCGGSGHVRSVSSVALQLLRAIEEMLIKGATHNLIVRTRSEVALYVLNHKRAHLRSLEERFRITITISADATVPAQQSFIVDRGEQVHTVEAARAIAASAAPPVTTVEEEEEEHYDEEIEEEESAEAAAGEMRPHDGAQEFAHEHVPGDQPQGEREGGGRRRRRRRRGRGRGRGGEGREGEQFVAHEQGAQSHAPESIAQAGEQPGEETGAHDELAAREQPYQPGGQPTGGEGREGEGGRRRRRRGRRGGRRNRHGRNGDGNFPPSTGMSGDDQGRPYQAENFDDAPQPEPAREYEPPPRESAPYSPPSPQQQPEAPPAAPETGSEAPRRRSTIREPAPGAGSDTTAPMPSPTFPPPPTPTPVVSSTGEGESAQPKRGWWGKRLLGDKG